jgi:hypothetical protein
MREAVKKNYCFAKKHYFRGNKKSLVNIRKNFMQIKMFENEMAL